MTSTSRQRIGSATGADIARPLFVLAVFTSTWNAIDVGGLQFVDIFLVLAAGLCALDAATSERRVAIPWWVLTGTLGILLVATVHIFAPTDIGYQNSRFMLLNTERLAAADGTLESLLVAIQWCVAVAVLPLVAAYLARSRPEFVHSIATAFVLGVAVSAAVATSDWIGFTQIGQGLIGGQSITGRQNGFASHVNNLGFACVIATPLALHLFGRNRLLAVLALVLIGGGAFVSGSRTAQLGTILALLISMIVLRVARRAAVRFAILGVAAVTVFIISSPQVLELVPTLLRFDSAGGAASDLGRFMVGQQALADFGTRPVFGVGMPVITHAHSVPLQLLAAGGIVLTVAMALYWAGALNYGLKFRHAAESVGLAATISVGLWIVQFFFQNQLVDRFLYVPIAIIIAVAAAATASHPEQRATRAVRARGGRSQSLSPAAPRPSRA